MVICKYYPTLYNRLECLRILVSARGSGNQFGLYANITPLYVTDLSVCGFWYLQRVLVPIPCRSPGTTVSLDEKASCQSLLIVCYHFFFKRRKIKEYAYLLACVIHIDCCWQDE